MKQRSWLKEAYKPHEKPNAKPTENHRRSFSVERTLCKRPCAVVDGIRYFHYSSEEQEGRVEKWVKGSIQAVCEHCGTEISTWNLFYWRLFGLCSTCYEKAEKTHVTDFVQTKIVDGNPVCRWEKPGGKEKVGGSVETFNAQHT